MRKELVAPEVPSRILLLKLADVLDQISEALGLLAGWNQVDRIHHTLSVAHSWDLHNAGREYARRTLGPPKGGPRTLPIPKELWPLFEALWQERAEGGGRTKDDVLRGAIIKGGLVVRLAARRIG